MNSMLTTTPRQSWDMLGDIDHFMNNLFGNPATQTAARAPVREGRYIPPVDVAETERAYKVRVELAGVSKDDLDVTIDDGVLTITAERKDEHDEEVDGRLIRQERRYGKFTRSLKLAEDVLEEDVAARYENGILTLELPKSEQKQPRKVQVLGS